MKLAVVLLSDATNIHVEALSDLATTLFHHLKDLGHDVTLERSASVYTAASPGTTPIVFGAHYARRIGVESFPKGTIIYNTEQAPPEALAVDARHYWFKPELLRLYREHTVWDYSAVNAQRLSTLLGKEVLVVPFGYHKSLERVNRVPEEERDIDVLFYGSENERRLRVIRELRAAGVHVHTLFATYGAQLDAYLARAKIVLNVHYYDSAIFEQARVHYCVANKICVVSESSAGGEGSNTALCVDYDKLVSTVKSLVHEPTIRRSLEVEAYTAYRTKSAQPVYDAIESYARDLEGAVPVAASEKIADTATEKPDLTLCMIVKNEAAVIRRCLESVKPHVKRWCIVDTGSTDGTQQIVREFMADLPGELLEQPWTREDHNRTLAFNCAAALPGPAPGCPSTYVLWIDADEVFCVDDEFYWPKLTADTYEVLVRSGVTSFARPQILKASLMWRWVGRVHPYLEAGNGSGPAVRLQGAYTQAIPDGASWADPDKYKKHAALLEEDCAEQPDNARFRYYLAQSYRDAGEAYKARENYLKRAGMSGWDEETWSATYEVARMTEILNRGGGPEAVNEIVAAYVNAWRKRPTRAEPLWAVSSVLNWSHEHAAALLFAREAARLPLPVTDRLFVLRDVYAWKALDELALAAHHLGEDAEAWAAFKQVLEIAQTTEGFPAGDKARIENNARFILPPSRRERTVG